MKFLRPVLLLSVSLVWGCASQSREHSASACDACPPPQVAKNTLQPSPKKHTASSSEQLLESSQTESVRSIQPVIGNDSDLR